MPDKFEPTARDAFDIARSQPALIFQPRAAAEYSNSDYMVLGQIIEKVSGRTSRYQTSDLVKRSPS